MTGGRVAPLVVALALVGCGSGNEGSDDFQRGYNSAIAEVADAGSGLERTGGQSNRAISRDFERIADSWESTRAKLSRLEPPENARDEFDELLSALEQGVGDLRSAAHAAREGNPERFAEARESLAKTSEEISKAEEALKDEVEG